MSVGITVDLPDQPGASTADGQINIIPLGGDGYVAPQSMYSGVINLDADVSGGNQTITVTRDPRFEQLVSFFTFTTIAPSADKVVTWFCQPSADAPTVFAMSQTCATVNRCGLTMQPPLIMPWLNWTVQQGNVDSEDATLNFQIYNYAIDCTKKVPLNIILASVPSVGLIFPSI